jgi:RNA polymerase sigma-70 factor (ECF subfamily)
MRASMSLCLAPALDRAPLPDCATAWAQILAAVDRAAAPPATVPAVAAEHLLAQQDRLRRLVHRLLGWRGNDVDDLVQDVLLSAWQHRAAFRGDSSLSTWLVRIAVRRVQRHARWQRLRDGLRALVPASDVGTAATPPLGDEIQSVHRAMASLRHGDREVLVLRYLEDRSIEDTAQALGISRQAADQRLSRARQRLRALLPHLEEP